MLGNLVQRWKSWRQPPPPLRPAPAARAPVRAAAPAAKAPPQAAAPATPAASLLAIGARRPLVNAKGGVAGFEFRLAEATLRRLARPEGNLAAAAHSRALFAAMRLTADSGRLAYTELPAGWLRLPHLPSEIGKGCLLALPDRDVATPFDEPVLAQLKALRQAGARVGWAGSATQAIAPDFAVVHPVGDDLSSLRSRGLPLLARDVDDIELLEAALRAGVELACCSIVQHSEPKDAQPIAPQMPRLCHLLNRLVQGAETGPVIADIKADVGLAYRLLHHFNNVGVGGGRSIESIEQAVLLLGRNELYRWLSVLLIRFAADRPASTALKEIALARARFFELLAIDAKEPAPGSLFTLGLASMLGLLMNVRLADAIEPLNLPDAALDALLRGQGPWQPYLALATALEQSTGEQAEALAVPYGGLARVLERSAEAWHWAQHAGDDPV